MSKTVRVRFAPSPTGPLHIGGVRTALFNYLYAKKEGGQFILRIEDTDQSRYVEGTEDYIKSALAWSGIVFDEGPDEGGEFGPYRQSERKDIYAKYALQLIDEGKAYYAFDTPEELEAMRERLKSAKVANPVYNSITRNSMKNSLTLSKEEVKARIAAAEPYVIRLNVPQKEEIRVNDLIRGWVLVHSSTIDDKIILKSDGMPTYHLANIVDDHLMKITHVIRGEEWLPSAPLHVLLYQYLGWEEEMPQFAHLPLILKPDGNGKLSKRDSEKHGFPIFPMEWQDPQTSTTLSGFKEEGYLSEAFINFLVLLGWNPGTEQELFSLEEMIQAFSIERIGKAGTRFDIDKAKWYNQQYIKEIPLEELANSLLSRLDREGIVCEKSKAAQIAEMMRERIVFPQELYEKAKYLFAIPKTFDEKIVKKKWTEEAVFILADLRRVLESLDDFDADSIKMKLNEALDKNQVPIGKIMPALRLAITGVGGGPDLMKIIEIIGKDQTIKRISLALEELKDKVKVKNG